MWNDIKYKILHRQKDGGGVSKEERKKRGIEMRN